MRMRSYLLPLLLTFAGMAHAVDPSQAFRPWSAVEKFDVEKLAHGKIATECNGSMSFARGMSAQAVYVVAVGPEAAVRVLLNSDPSKHPEEETFQRPLFHNEAEAGFGKLVFDPKLACVRRLLEAMRKCEGLHLTREETALLPKTGAIEDAQRFWSETMSARWNGWTQRGELRATEAFDMRADIASLLKEEPKLAHHFAALLTPFTQPGAPTVPAIHYWDWSNVNHTAAVCLGTIYVRTVDVREQVLDVSYYASSGYLASVTLYELAPITLDGQPRSLVWEGCLVSAPALAGGFGVKKAIGARLMVGDLEKSIRFFQQDAGTAR